VDLIDIFDATVNAVQAEFHRNSFERAKGIRQPATKGAQSMLRPVGSP